MNTLSVNQKILISALIGFIIGAGSIIIWNTVQSVPDVKISEEKNEVNTVKEIIISKNVPLLIEEQARVDVDDQVAGNSVFVLTIVLERAGWVAIHEDNDGQLGNVLGARLYSQGQSRGDVELLRDTTPGNVYHVVLYNDNGNGAFELGIDALIVDTEQQPIRDTFRTLGSSL